MIEIDTSGANGVDYSSQPPPPAAGAYGNGQPAANGTPATDHGKSCGVPAGNGEDGHTGLPGIDGAKGGDGGDGSDFIFSIDRMEGGWEIDVSGGDGGGGQTGGKGGSGQDAGIGGDGSVHCAPGKIGSYGVGGAGGAGGDGGKPGNAGNIYITYRQGSADIQRVNVTPGAAGAGGDGGPGGPNGGSRGDGSGPVLINRGSGPTGAPGKMPLPKYGSKGFANINGIKGSNMLVWS